MAVITVTEENYDALVGGSKPVLLDFWADWCGPCRMVSPIVDEIAGERQDILVGKVNVDEQMGLARKFRVMSIPTLVVLRDGKTAATSIGFKSKAEILAMLDV